MLLALKHCDWDCHCQPPRPADQVSFASLLCPQPRVQQGLVGGGGYSGKGVGGRQLEKGRKGGEGGCEADLDLPSWTSSVEQHQGRREGGRRENE